MKFRFRSVAPQPGLSVEELRQGAEVLETALAENAVLERAVTAALPRMNALGVQATVHANNNEIAISMALASADEEWGRVLREAGFEHDDRTGHLREA